MYTAHGLPIYDYTFNPEFEISDGFLLSAFLTSLNQYAAAENIDPPPSTLQLDEQEIQIEYSDELKLSTLELEDDILLFYHGDDAELSIGVGISKKHYTSINTLFNTTQLMVEIDQYMRENYENFDWGFISGEELDKFENELHSKVIHRFVEPHTAEDNCYLDEKCPFRHAEPPPKEEEPPPSFRDRLRSRFRRDK